jgi:hypothetical protein
MIQPEAVTGWLNSKRAMLEQNPSLRRAIEARDPTAITNEIRNLNAQREAAQDASLDRLLTQQGGAKTALDKAMGNSESMREIRNRVGNDADSVAALKRGVWERVLAKGNKGIAEFTGSEEGRRVLNIVYQGDQTHLKNIKTILDANETLGRSRPAAGSAEKAVTPDSWARENLGQSVPSLINAGNSALVTERASKAWTAATLFTRFANSYTQRQADDALKAALFDPKVAGAGTATVAAGVSCTDRTTPPLITSLSEPGSGNVTIESVGSSSSCVASVRSTRISPLAS